MPRLRSGGSFATEWGKKGHTLIRIGDDHQNEPERLLAILDECERAGIYAMYTPSMANNIIKTGQSGFDMEGLVSNITLVKDHPALWGYYICDDCCSNAVNISLQSQVYQLIKDLDVRRRRRVITYYGIDIRRKKENSPQPMFHITKRSHKCAILHE